MSEVRLANGKRLLITMDRVIYSKSITPGKENYLKALLDLSHGESVRSVDIANNLGVSKASVSVMMGKLKDDGYILKEKDGAISLTDKGRKEAQTVKNRYNLLRQFLVMVLGVDPLTAGKDACLIEHIISPNSIEKINEKLNIFKQYSKQIKSLKEV